MLCENVSVFLLYYCRGLFYHFKFLVYVCKNTNKMPPEGNIKSEVKDKIRFSTYILRLARKLSNGTNNNTTKTKTRQDKSSRSYQNIRPGPY